VQVGEGAKGSVAVVEKRDKLFAEVLHDKCHDERCAFELEGLRVWVFRLRGVEDD
jgi:hypothetical protein